MQLNTSETTTPKSKIKIILLAGLAISAGIAITISLYQKTSKPIPPEQPPPAPTTELPPAPVVETTPSKIETQAHFINTVLSPKPVTGYSWSNNQLLYSTPNGIYQAGTNTPIIKKSINKISWSANGQALYQSNTQWFWFQEKSILPQPININLSSPQISPDGELAAEISETKLKVTNLRNNQIMQTSLKVKATNLRWVSQNNWIAVEQKTNDNPSIVILDNQLQQQTTSPVDTNTTLLAISPNASHLVLKNNDTIQIKPTTGNPINIKLQPNSTLNATWIKNNQLIIIETTKDRINRKIDHIWRITLDQTNATQELLANSQPIPRKLDPNTTLIPNPKKSVLPLVEKQGELWLLALIPNQLPSYSKTGLAFFPISTESEH